MSLVSRIVGRLGAGLVVLWGAATLTFLAMHATAGDPAIAVLGGPDALPTPEVVEQVRREYGFDQPLIVQYGRYLGRLAAGDLGMSYQLRAPVAEVIAESAGSSFQLAAVAALVSLLIAVAVATATAGRGRAVSRAMSSAEVMLTTTPSFVIGIMLLFLFAYALRLLPVAGGDGAAALVMPVLTIALSTAPMMSQMLRGELDRILEQPFITTARARGLGEAGVRLGHALRHALVPLLTLAGFYVGVLMGGMVITETLFARAGLGRLVVDAAMSADVPVVTGVALLAAAVYVLVNLVVDLINARVDPRSTPA